MIPKIDLIPESCRRRLGRGRQIQVWLSVYAVTVVVFTAAGVTLRFTQQHAQQRVDVLNAQVQLDADQQRQAGALLSQISRQNEIINRHEHLTWSFKISDVIGVVGELTPDAATLTSLTITPRVAAGRSGGVRKFITTKDYRVMYVEIAGIAPDDLDIASFVSGLQRHPLFSSITIDYARKAKLGKNSAREFGLTCEIDLRAKYVIDEGLSS